LLLILRVRTEKELGFSNNVILEAPDGPTSEIYFTKSYQRSFKKKKHF